MDRTTALPMLDSSRLSIFVYTRIEGYGRRSPNNVVNRFLFSSYQSMTELNPIRQRKARTRRLSVIRRPAE